MNSGKQLCQARCPVIHSTVVGKWNITSAVLTDFSKFIFVWKCHDEGDSNYCILYDFSALTFDYFITNFKKIFVTKKKSCKQILSKSSYIFELAESVWMRVSCMHVTPTLPQDTIKVFIFTLLDVPVVFLRINLNLQQYSCTTERVLHSTYYGIANWNGTTREGTACCRKKRPTCDFALVQFHYKTFFSSIMQENWTSPTNDQSFPSSRHQYPIHFSMTDNLR